MKPLFSEDELYGKIALFAHNLELPQLLADMPYYEAAEVIAESGYAIAFLEMLLLKTDQALDSAAAIDDVDLIIDDVVAHLFPGQEDSSVPLNPVAQMALYLQATAVSPIENILF